MRAAPRARIEPAPGAAVTKIKTTKINSGAFCRRITKFNSPENYPLYGIQLYTCSHLQVLSGVINRLFRYGVIYHSNCERMSKYQLLHARDQFRINGCPAGVAVSILTFYMYNIHDCACTGMCGTTVTMIIVPGICGEIKYHNKVH